VRGRQQHLLWHAAEPILASTAVGSAPLARVARAARRVPRAVGLLRVVCGTLDTVNQRVAIFSHHVTPVTLAGVQA
jgi:hypothetical protein